MSLGYSGLSNRVALNDLCFSIANIAFVILYHLNNADGIFHGMLLRFDLGMKRIKIQSLHYNCHIVIQERFYNGSGLCYPTHVIR